MNIRRIHSFAFWFMLFIGLILPTLTPVPSIAQSQETKQDGKSWQSRLYEKEVKYENFACSKGDSEIIATFFKEHPLKSILPVCHNDCPVIKCRPVIPFPPIAKAARAIGTISVHILVDEKGRVLYARELSGHPLLRATARKGACETQFNVYPYHKRQGVLHFTVEDYEYLGVPNEANQVL